MPSLWEQILVFKKYRIITVIALIAIGMLGLVIPVIPGLLLIILAVALIKPGMMAKLRERLKSWKV